MVFLFLHLSQLIAARLRRSFVVRGVDMVILAAGLESLMHHRMLGPMEPNDTERQEHYSWAMKWTLHLHVPNPTAAIQSLRFAFAGVAHIYNLFPALREGSSFPPLRTRLLPSIFQASVVVL